MKYKIYEYQAECDINIAPDNTYYLLYKIVNIKTGQYYIGIHKTKKLNDGYSGSGKALYRAMNLSNKNDFKKIIIGCFQTSEEMINAESKYVTMEQVNDPLCFNLCPGGYYTGECFRRTAKGSVFMWHPETKQRTRVYPEMIKTYKSNGWIVGYGDVPIKVKSGTITGKIYISKNKELRVIEESDLSKYESMGWVRGVDGRSHSRPLTGRKRMYDPNTNESKIVKCEDWDSFTKLGWKFGMGKRKLTGTLNWIHKNDVYKKVRPEDLQSYLDAGWERSGPAKGSIHIYKGPLHKMVHADAIQGYLDSGWSKIPQTS